jgi:hypothetical protein
VSLPTGATFNELDGEEAKEILVKRFRARLDEVPYLQRHITLPRVKMSLLVTLSLYNDQPTPELHEISDEYSLLVLNDSVNVSPTPGGRPPDAVRDDHSLPIPQQIKVDKLPYHADVLGGRVVTNDSGLVVDRTGAAPLPNSTFVTMDQGPAGLARGGSRESLGIFKNEWERSR